MDSVFLHGMKIDTLIGVYDWERTQTQTIILDIDITLNAAPAGQSDRIGDTVHYGEVADAIRMEISKQSFQLLEALAEYVANVILNDFSCQSVRIKAIKPGILPDVREVGVMIERSKKDIE